MKAYACYVLKEMLIASVCIGGLLLGLFFILEGRWLDFSAFNLIYWFKSHTFRDNIDEWYTVNSATVYPKISEIGCWVLYYDGSWN